jgi:hypothetical protein
MRIRNRTVVRSWFPAQPASSPQWTLTECLSNPPSNGNYSYAADPATPIDYVDEYLEDETGKGSSHACRHRKKIVVIPDVNFAPIYISLSPNGTLIAPDVAYRDSIHLCGSGSNLYGRLGWDITHPSSLPIGWTINDSSLDWGRLILDVREKSKQLKADMLLNLVQANQAWPSVTELALCLPNLKKHWKELSKVVKFASNGLLAWKFGVSPIISDITNTHRYLAKMRDDLKRHGEQDLFRYSSKQEFQASYSQADYVDLNATGADLIVRHYEGDALIAPTARVVLIVKPSVKYHTDFFKKLDGLMSRFTTSPASFAWEIVPFSFVVDWFVDLRGVLDSIDKLVGFNPYEVVSMTKSYTYDLREVGMTTFRSPCGGHGVITQTPKSSVRHRHYERNLVSGEDYPSWRPRFGKSQAAISAALIGQQLSRIRR